MHQSLFVFDIETVPDYKLFQRHVGNDSKDLSEIKESFATYHLEITNGKNSFPRPIFHKVVAISFIEASIESEGSYETFSLKDIRSGGTVASNEAELIKGFFQHVGKKFPRLVSYNGKGFDLPILRYRAMKYAVSAPWLYRSGDKWNNYMQRYSMDWHCDLLDILSDYGASTKVRLDEVCSLVGLPGKVGVSGSDVEDLYEADQLTKIRNYCETDVLNTYLVYIHYMHHRGVLRSENFETALQEVQEWLISRQETHAHFAEFLAHWQDPDKLKLQLLSN